MLVTHDLREAMSLADRIGVLDGGRLVAIATATDLRKSREGAVRSLLSSAELEMLA